MNGGMRLGSNLGGVYETNADGTLKPVDEAKMMGQLKGAEGLEGPDKLKAKELEGPDKLKAKELEGPKELEGDESGGLSKLFEDVEAEKPVVETGKLDVDAEPSSANLPESDIIKADKKSKIEIIDPDSKQFKIAQWDDYPDDIVPMPDQNKTWQLLEDDNYQNARKQANKANRELRKGDPGYYKNNNIEIHEVEPVKFGGDPASPKNKVGIQAGAHRQVVTPWWNKIQKEAEEEFNKLEWEVENE